MSSRTQTVDMSSTTAYKVPMLSYVILRAHANLPRHLFEGGVYFTQRLQLCGIYSRTASIRGRRLFAEIRYELVDAIRVHHYTYLWVLINCNECTLDTTRIEVVMNYTLLGIH